MSNLGSRMNESGWGVVAVLWVAALVLVLAGCGGGGSSSGGNQDRIGTSESSEIGTGVFLDAAVEGIYYVSGDISGYTDGNGTFRYRIGATVIFKIGDIVIGEAKGKEVVTPVDFVPDGDASHPTVVNIVRFLMTIDDDGNPGNGIQITSAMRNLATGSINFAQSIQAFSDDGNVQTIISTITTTTQAGSRVALVSGTEASRHLSNTIWSYYAGSYSGTFSGDDNGTFNITVRPDGVITGTGRSNIYDQIIAISGHMGTDGNISFGAGGTSTGARFYGRFEEGGILTGTWENPEANASGTFSGKKVESGAQTSNGESDGDNTGAGGTLGSVTVSGDGLDGTYPFNNVDVVSSAPGIINYMWTNVNGGSGVSALVFQDMEMTTNTYTVKRQSIVLTARGLEAFSCGSLTPCSGYTFDESARTLTFNNVQLSLVGSTRSITLNGTLRY